MRRSIAWALCCLTALAWSVPRLIAAEHVRVVLDVSGSMKKNDPERLAVLSSLLLHDLAAPNPTLGDSFEIIPFDRDWQWSDPSAPPPVPSRERLQAGFERRDELAAALLRLDYDARKTYFYPGLRAAAEDLATTPGGLTDVRVVVLLTDGVPEPEIREREAELIRRDLVPLFEEHGIRLYVLAFSAEAQEQRKFLESMLGGSSDGRLGELFLDPEGDELLSHMVELFARSFGYKSDGRAWSGGPEKLDLEAREEVEKVAVVVHTPRPEPPSLRLAPPSGGSLNAPAGIVTARRPEGSSYSLVWVLSPHPGAYELSSNANSGRVAVLRPARLNLEILPAPGRRHADVAMADRPFPLRVRVKSTHGGDPGPVDLSFRPRGQSWRGERGAPAPGPGLATAEGRVYDVVTRFEAPAETGETYTGRLELEARRGEAVIGARRGDDAHRVEVHPLLALAPLPLTAYAAEGALGAGEAGCVEFDLDLVAGELPHPDRDVYTLRAVLEPGDPEVLDQELRGAFFTLDDLPLGFEGQAEAGAWYEGHTLAGLALVGEHRLCARLGRPTAGDPGAPLDLALRWTLVESPYDDFRVVDSFTLKVLIAPPGPLDRWRPALWAGGLLALLLGSLWHLRDRPTLPPDLGYALGRPGAELEGRSWGSGSWTRRLLGLIHERPLIVPGEETTVGWVRPASEELYQMRPAPEVRLHRAGGEAVPLVRGLATLEAQSEYLASKGPTSWALRLQYS